MIITQIIWLACLPVIIYVSFRLVVFSYNQSEKKKQ
jgi:hypothetical protein